MPGWLLQLLGGGLVSAVSAGFVSWRKSRVEATDSAVARYDKLSERLTSEITRIDKERDDCLEEVRTLRREIETLKRGRR